MAPASAASESDRVRRDGVTRRDPPLSLASAASLAPKGGSDFGRKAEGLAFAAEQNGDAGMGEGLHARREALRFLGEAAPGDAVHGAEGDDHVRPFVIVVNRRGDEIEKPGRDLRVLDMEGEGVRMGEPLDGKGDGHAASADGDDEARPRRFERRVGSDEAEEA